MKKWMGVIFALCSSIIGNAQVQLGVKAGLNISGLTNRPPEEYLLFPTSYGTKIAFNSGLIASIPLSSFLSLQPELYYSQQGTNASNSAIDKSFNYDYLNFPVLFKIQDPSGMFGETGPQIGFLLSSVKKNNGKTIQLDEIQPIDFSWVIGAGYKIPNFPLGFDIRYTLGLTNTNKQTNFENSKNSVFQIDVFCLFKLKKST